MADSKDGALLIVTGNGEVFIEAGNGVHGWLFDESQVDPQGD
jgi:uncharacterized membrane protein YgcG